MDNQGDKRDINSPSVNSIAGEKAQTYKIFTIKSDPESKKRINVYEGSPDNEQPLYSIAPTKSSSSHLTITYGHSSPPDIIGTADLHSFTNFNTDLTYRNVFVKIRPSTVTYNHDMDYPGRGRYSWAPETNSRSKDLFLTNRDGPPIAILRSPKMVAKGGTQLELLKSCDEEEEGLIVCSAIAIGSRGHLKADVLGAAVGFGAVGI